jgi:alpha-beta hydrolase superfamily lysophospholipase
VGPERTLDDVVAFLRARDDADPAVAPSMRSQVERGQPGAGVVVLLHGLTASPPAWRAVADALHARGRTVIVPRLLLHGHTDRMTTALSALTADALVADTIAIVEQVAGLGEDVVLAGHSLGATLALDAAARVPGLARVVAIAPFLGIASIPHEGHDAIGRFVRRLPNLFLWWDPFKRERQMPAHGYPRYPMNALLAGIAIADRLRADAGRPVHGTSIEIVLNAGEMSVNNRTARRLAADWSAAGAAVTVDELRGLGPSHDIIDPDRGPARVAFERVLALIDGRS